MSIHRAIILAALIAGQIFTPRPVTAANDSTVSKEQMDRGSALYARYCFMCHQSSGQGKPPEIPPLAQSDFLSADTERSVRILITGLTGPITVRNDIYHGVMPPAPYDDQQLADVLTYVHNSFGNHDGAVTLEQVQKIHSQVAATAKVADPNPFAPLPSAPAGFTLREVVRLPNYPTRMASDGQGRALYILCENADVWRVELPGGSLRRILNGEDYADASSGTLNCVGLALDNQQRLYIVANSRHETRPFVTNEVTIYRTTQVHDGDPAEPRAWFKTSYPWGVSCFNHGVGNIAAGPDGHIYVSSGSRTDDNEAGVDPNYFTGGEVPITACFWRLDPNAAKPEIEVFARGVRNPFGFCWNDRGEMFATENGPDADAPEELNQIVGGKHYGFPYQFSNWTNKPYAYTPNPPAGLQITFPIANLGPDAGGSSNNPLFTFEPHSSPGGIVYLGDDFPADYRGTFLVTRFGNLLAKPKDVGFDLLNVRMEKNARGVYEARINKLLSPLARPIDVHLAGKGKVYICEYTRVLDNSGKTAMLPGRLLELAVKPKQTAAVN